MLMLMRLSSLSLDSWMIIILSSKLDTQQGKSNDINLNRVYMPKKGSSAVKG